MSEARRKTTINNKQKALLHVARQQLGLEDDIYRLILETEAGVSSAKDLTPEGFDRVMVRMEALGFEPRLRYQRHRATKPNPDETVTPAQQKRINDLYEELGWKESKRRQGFNRRVVGKPWPQTREEAIKIIEALKAMLARGYDQD